MSSKPVKQIPKKHCTQMLYPKIAANILINLISLAAGLSASGYLNILTKFTAYLI